MPDSRRKAGHQAPRGLCFATGHAGHTDRSSEAIVIECTTWKPGRNNWQQICFPSSVGDPLRTVKLWSIRLKFPSWTNSS